jgi:predicted flavoprotein YhiN
MEQVIPFGDVLEAVDKLSLEDQEMLLDVLQRRIIECHREELVKDIEQAQQEFQAGQCRPVGPEELKHEIVSSGGNYCGPVPLSERQNAW